MTRTIVFGDFNVVRSTNERLGLVFCVAQATEFNIFIYKGELVDIHMCGRKFTRVDRDGSKLSRLDRFLISEDLLDDILDISSIALDLRWSDHCPLFLK